MLNKYKNSTLFILIATVMMIILSSPVRADTHNYYWYYVEWGDTLSELSETYYQDIETVAEINNIENIDLIYADSYLKFINNLREVPQETESKDEKNDKSKDTVKENKQKKEKQIERVRNMVKISPYYISSLGGN
ncbi:LysM domain-containing protein [Nosocomiicoccus sp. HMSC059G07]|uniref:LysM peptidoglycan-binding domain-containing protein n=1 Tax=Nosocomiicoccus sp. HMSC059G07 TaxID=1739531 RepID=UPI0008A1ED22|nr:LysM domain-containing protein [Nosocomiicoccus sp. HMSC059G07]OFO55313.1 hypothetical protein HMPREF3029_04650 [Nosocomiicoccus sp. HMSC059G07]